MKLHGTLLAHLRRFAVRFGIAYPVCFYMYGSIIVALSCVKNFNDLCIPMVVFSPLFMIFGPLAHDAFHALVITLSVVAIWTLCTTMGRSADQTRGPSA